jgi:hypothetical protein
VKLVALQKIARLNFQYRQINDSVAESLILFPVEIAVYLRFSKTCVTLRLSPV